MKARTLITHAIIEVDKMIGAQKFNQAAFNALAPILPCFIVFRHRKLMGVQNVDGLDILSQKLHLSVLNSQLFDSLKIRSADRDGEWRTRGATLELFDKIKSMKGLIYYRESLDILHRSTN